MLRRILLAFPISALLPAIAGCGGVVEMSPPKGDAGAHPLLRPDGGRDAAFPEATLPNDANGADLSPYQDPGCPDVAVLPIDNECDPYAAPPGDCRPGEGCSPYIQYPDTTCGQPQYGTVCLVTGRGQQGEPCGDGADCTAGFVCVESRDGSQCVRICDPNSFGSCPDGQVCDTLDVPGYGGCL